MPFASLTTPAADPLLALMGKFRADRRPHKLDLGVGVYRNADGSTPVFHSVKRAEDHLLLTQTTKSYLGCEGDPEFVARLADEVFRGETGIGGLQTVGGTGALRLAAEFLARTSRVRQIWVCTPTWQNHLPVFGAAGLRVVTIEGRERLLTALRSAPAGDAVLLQACCHNPTGEDPLPGFWDELTGILNERGLVPLMDMAYQGMGLGWDEDAAALRRLAGRVPYLFVAYSCSKNFALYRERVGALFIIAPSAAERQSLCGHLAMAARTGYSMPPDHGAAIVRVILSDERLRDDWRGELECARTRLRTLRHLLAARGRIGEIDLTPLHRGNGMFATLPLSASRIDRLQDEFAIYVAASGRINIAGLRECDIDAFTDALGLVQLRKAA